MAEETILIVEDNPVNQKLFMTVLRPHGYRLLAVADGEEAVRVALRERPNLVLMDLQLPKMNGYETTKVLKGNAITSQIPIIALTAHAMQEERVKALGVGFDGFITKPINTRSFPGQIRELLNSSVK